MPLAALVLGLLGAALLVGPLALGGSVEGWGPFSGPLGGGLCVTALVLAGVAALSPERRARAPRLVPLALGIAVLGVAGALAIEWHLIRRDHADRDRLEHPVPTAAPRRTP